MGGGGGGGRESSQTSDLRGESGPLGEARLVVSCFGLMVEATGVATNEDARRPRSYGMLVLVC